jgi:hypothetical protein
VIRRQLLRCIAVAIGAGIGGGLAYGTARVAGVSTVPRCPRCGSRADVHEIAFTSLPDGKLNGTVGGRSIGLYTPGQGAPDFNCNRCWMTIGSRTAVAGPRPVAGSR